MWLIFFTLKAFRDATVHMVWKVLKDPIVTQKTEVPRVQWYGSVPTQKPVRECVCGGNRYENMIKSLTFVMKMNGTSELLVLHRNGYTFKTTSTFPWVISYVPLVLGYRLHQVDQDLQARPKHMGGKEMVTWIFTVLICWRCKRRLPGDYLYSLWSCYSRFSL